MEIKVEGQKEKQKIVLMAVLLAGSCFLTYYFHQVLQIGTVFTHLFYIPIILASLWWKRKGVAVALFLALFLVLSHHILREYVLAANDYLRACMFVLISVVIALLSERIAKAQEKVGHLNRILYSIRNVNQLITKEKDRDRLLKGACDNLTQTRGYYNAWIVLFDENRDVVTTAESGLGKDFLPMVDRLKGGTLTDCGQKALGQAEVVVTEDPPSTCTDCPLSAQYSGRGAMTIRLEHEGKIYGIVSASVPKDFLSDEEKQLLFQEVSADIAFALHNIELEEERKKAEEKIQASLKEKEVLLKEVHHRVKNNLQVISSLLNLQSQHITDKASRAMFEESQSRVRAMALIHEKLYTSEDLAHIDIAEYIHSLTHQLITTYSTIVSRVSMNIAITDIFLTVTTAIPCGLIINELVTNALKHAFPHQQKGTITVSMTPSTKDSLILTVSDTGIGFSEGIDFRNTTTLGMQLVTSLVPKSEIDFMQTNVSYYFNLKKQFKDQKSMSL